VCCVGKEETSTYHKSDGYFKVNCLCFLFDVIKDSVSSKLQFLLLVSCLK